jgi:hypothetical protein
MQRPGVIFYAHPTIASVFVVESGDEFFVHGYKESVEKEAIVVAGELFNGYYFLIRDFANLFLDFSTEPLHRSFSNFDLTAY